MRHDLSPSHPALPPAHHLTRPTAGMAGARTHRGQSAAGSIAGGVVAGGAGQAANADASVDASSIDVIGGEAISESAVVPGNARGSAFGFAFTGTGEGRIPTR